MIKRILQEPLLHFLLIGAGLFLVYGSLPDRDAARRPERIVISQGLIDHLATGFARTWQRPPTPEELAGLIGERVREEVYCREAMALGLDQDDTVIRRRLRQKMEFISDDIAAQAEPTDEQLIAYLSDHAAAFRTEPRLTFRHVFLNPAERGEALERDAEQLVALLNHPGTDPSNHGDPFLLEHEFTDAPLSDVAKQFGGAFADALLELTPGRWQGPVESGYGVHLVLVTHQTAGRDPDLAEVRDLVRREWANARRMEINDRMYQQLRSRYTVMIEGMEAPSDPPTLPDTAP